MRQALGTLCVVSIAIFGWVTAPSAQSDRKPTATTLAVLPARAPAEGEIVTLAANVWYWPHDLTSYVTSGFSRTWFSCRSSSPRWLP